MTTDLETSLLPGKAPDKDSSICAPHGSTHGRGVRVWRGRRGQVAFLGRPASLSIVVAATKVLNLLAVFERVFVFRLRL